MKRSKFSFRDEQLQKAKYHINSPDANIQLDFSIEEIPPKGVGVKTLQFISKDSYICTYRGKVYTKKEGSLLEQKYYNRFAFYFVHNGKQLCIFPTETPNIKDDKDIGLFFNHSRRNPNLIPRLLFNEDKVPYICFFAKNDIEPLTELLFDYGDRSKDSLILHPWLNN
jgi:histone-lysine N-methyltransferase SETD8